MGGNRTKTPDLKKWDSLTPSTTQFSKVLQPNPLSQSQPQSPSVYGGFSSPPLQPLQPLQLQPQGGGLGQGSAWGASAVGANPWASGGIGGNQTLAQQSLTSSLSTLSMQNRSGSGMGMRPSVSASSAFSLPPPPPANAFGGFASAGSTAFKTSVPQSNSGSVAYGAFQGGGMGQQQPSAFGGMGMGQQGSVQGEKKGLDKWESLL